MDFLPRTLAIVLYAGNGSSAAVRVAGAHDNGNEKGERETHTMETQMETNLETKLETTMESQKEHGNNN